MEKDKKLEEMLENVDKNLHLSDVRRSAEWDKNSKEFHRLLTATYCELGSDEVKEFWDEMEYNLAAFRYQILGEK